MERNPSRLSRKNENRKATRARRERKNRYGAVEDGGDLIECSGKFCRSCTAGLFADCVAICCCPCAVVNLLALALVKVPWIMGRRCLGLGKMKRKCEKKNEIEFAIERDGSLRNGRGAEVEPSEFLYGVGEEGEKDKVSARFEADKVWLELYQVGHLGFGRVSFTGIQAQGKSI